MSHDRDTRHSDTGHRPSPTNLPSTPGKATLTERLAGEAAPGPRRAGMTRDIEAPDGDGGARAARPRARARVANPSGGNVAATVVSATAETEVAFDGAFTPALLAALQANPDLSIDEVLEQIAANPIERDDGHVLHHPTIVQYGHRAQNGPEGGDAKKQAVLIANQNYVKLRQLGKPISEAEAMQTELASRGYDAGVHRDQSADTMTSLWGSMVDSARPGDDLVAFYGGHGVPEGLAGIHHDSPPRPPDLVSNAEVARVVSTATDKGAHIRFVLDSCFSGTAVQTVREERHNDLAAGAGTFGDKLRTAAMTSLLRAKKRLLAVREQRTATPRQLDEAIQQHEADAPDPADAEAMKEWTQVRDVLCAARPRVQQAFDLAVDRIWQAVLPVLNMVRTAVRHEEEPPEIEDYYTLAEQLNYLDDLWNAVSQPMERETTKAGAAPATRKKK